MISTVYSNLHTESVAILLEIVQKRLSHLDRRPLGVLIGRRSHDKARSGGIAGVNSEAAVCAEAAAEKCIRERKATVRETPPPQQHSPAAPHSGNVRTAVDSIR